MRSITCEDVNRLLSKQHAPCMSIYFPTEKSHPGRQKEPVRYANLVARAEETLRRKYPAAEARPLLDRLRALADDPTIWRHGPAGIAVLASSTIFETYGLQHSPPERAIVGDTFLLTPLLRVAQSADRFHVLCLYGEDVRLYEGNREALERIEPAGVPRTKPEALGAEDAVHPLEGPAADSGARQDQDRFLRALDRAVWEHVSRPSGLPLVLVAVPEQQAAFRSLSNNPQLLTKGVERGPAWFTDSQLLAEVWSRVEPVYRARVAKCVEAFEAARTRGQATDDLSEAAHAAHAGRVATLLVEADRVLPGQLDEETGVIGPAEEPDGGDLLGDLATLVLSRKGEVMVVPEDRMPTPTGLAAVYRF